MSKDDPEQKLTVVRRELQIAKNEIKRLHVELDKAEEVLGFTDRVGRANLKPPKLSRKARSKSAQAEQVTVCAILSDTHWDEVVQPEEVEGLNAYSREIATMRLRRWAENLIKLCEHYTTGVHIDGLVLMLGGDLMSGSIHDELRETNEDTLAGGIVYWVEELIATIDLLLTYFEWIRLPGVVGNHGRFTRKPRAKLRARDNIDWLIGKMIAAHYKGDERVKVFMSEAADFSFDVYDRTIRLTHGDQTRGGGGIGGIWPPIKRMEARKKERSDFDLLVMGHWHQLIQTQSMVVNGSTKGYDEYAYVSNFPVEDPQQAMWFETPKGISWQVGVRCAYRKNEEW